MSESRPESLCLLRLSALGDVSHAVPVVRTLQAVWPETRLHWVLGKAEAALLAGLDGVNLVPVDKRRDLRAPGDLRRALGETRFDTLLLMQISARSALMSRAIRARRRVGFDRARGKPWTGWVADERIGGSPRVHVLDGFFQFLAHLGVQERILRWDIPVPDDARAFAAARMPADVPNLVINPCASVRPRNWRNWHIKGYARVADYAAVTHGMQVVLTGGPSSGEREYARQIAAACREARPLNLVGRTDLKQLLAVLARARAVIAPDTGPAHLATAVGTPVIGLYATSNPERTGPYLSREWTVNRYPEAVRRFLGRSVDEVRWGRRVRHAEAMKLITEAAVIERLDALLAQGFGAVEGASTSGNGAVADQ